VETNVSLDLLLLGCQRFTSLSRLSLSEFDCNGFRCGCSSSSRPIQSAYAQSSRNALGSQLWCNLTVRAELSLWVNSSRCTSQGPGEGNQSMSFGKDFRLVHNNIVNHTKSRSQVSARCSLYYLLYCLLYFFMSLHLQNADQIWKFLGN
jgi:hypothetical protein